LANCAECRCVFIVITRQLTQTVSVLFSNGEINPEDGWYKNLCCGLDSYVLAGRTFPDCVRHKNLPTAWKTARNNSIPDVTPDRKKDSAA
jgi:hypothetical protein